MHVPGEDDDVQILSIWRQDFVGVMSFWKGAHAGAAKNRGVEADEHLANTRSFRLIQPLLELLHLLVIRRSSGSPVRRMGLFIFPGPQKNEASTLVIELIDQVVI